MWLFISFVRGGARSRPSASVSHPFSPEGNSLSSSHRPPIHCCPFVSHSIHGSWKAKHLSHFSLPFESYFCPSTAWLSCHVWGCILLQPIHPCSVIIIRMDASHARTHTPTYTIPGEATGGELMSLIIDAENKSVVMFPVSTLLSKC